MTSVLYDEIFVKFLGNIQDYDIPKMDSSDVNFMMIEYLHKASSRTYVRRLFKSLKFDDEKLHLTYELGVVTDEDQDKDFITTILAKGMVVEWLSPYVKSKLNMAQMFTGAEQKFYSQANHLSELRSLLEDTKQDLEKEILDRNCAYNEYLGD